MAEMNDTERARLIKLGNYAINHLRKLGNPLNPDDAEKPVSRTSMLDVLIDATKLVVFGLLLDKDGEGKKFFKCGTFLKMYPRLGINPSNFEETVNQMLLRFDKRNLMDNNAETLVIESGDPELVLKIKESYEAMLGWEAIGLAKEPQNCSFCGVVGREDRVLMACGRCKCTLYCDKVCQRLHWKKEHKAACVVKTNQKDGKKATKGEAA
ncbi:unnamed protein product [Zymoseptoria tritici ST99CH_3D7]|uniref:MYND-type domain-containing protein n=1 Tax=Zymoseptoria tritici (strain ST99CH_3D7) TaxID=1276538 RepID=A0A1X7S176_ZYMT9|nr:unnamed protein product [Zymoseptoria tritici ST99CH_3D7]